MILEALFQTGEVQARTAGMPEIERTKTVAHQRDRRALMFATQYAFAGVRQSHSRQLGKDKIDFPVGAVALNGDLVVGRYIASDRRTGFATLHAEKMAVIEAQLDPFGLPAKEIAVTMEPCRFCQDFLAKNGITRVIYALTRNQVAAKGLVKPHDEDIIARAARVNLPYEVVHIDDPRINALNNLLLDNTRRDIDSGCVTVDLPTFETELDLYLSSIVL